LVVRWVLWAASMSREGSSRSLDAGGGKLFDNFFLRRIGYTMKTYAGTAWRAAADGRRERPQLAGRPTRWRSQSPLGVRRGRAPMIMLVVALAAAVGGCSKPAGTKAASTDTAATKEKTYR